MDIDTALYWPSDFSGEDYFLTIKCNPEGTIFVGGKTLEYKTWKNNSAIQEEAFEEAYLHPYKTEFISDGPGGWAP